MFKIPVVYKDYNDKPHNEDLYFHMMLPEWVDLQFNPVVGNDFGKFVTDAMSSGDGWRVYAVFKILVQNSYGRRTEDGAGFVKNPEFTESFFQSPAWEQAFLWFTEKDKTGVNANSQAFWTGIVPPSFLEMNESASLPKANAVQTTEGRDITKLSREELEEMVRAKQ